MLVLEVWKEFPEGANLGYAVSLSPCKLFWVGDYSGLTLSRPSHILPGKPLLYGKTHTASSSAGEGGVLRQPCGELRRTQEGSAPDGEAQESLGCSRMFVTRNLTTSCLLPRERSSQQLSPRNFHGPWPGDRDPGPTAMQGARSVLPVGNLPEVGPVPGPAALEDTTLPAPASCVSVRKLMTQGQPGAWWVHDPSP